MTTTPTPTKAASPPAPTPLVQSTETEIKLGGVTLTSPKTQSQRLSLLLWGPSGCGKTTLAATAPGKKLWVNFDPNSKAALAERDDVVFAEFLDAKPDQVPKFCADNPMNIEKVIEAAGVDTVVFDSLTSFSELSIAHAVATSRGASVENPSIECYKKRNNLMHSMVTAFLRSTSRLNKHIIFIAHEAVPEKDKDGVVLYITLNLGGSLAEGVPTKIAEVWNMRDNNGKRMISVRPVRFRKPMTTRMFVSNGTPEFEWRYDPQTNKGDTIEKWYNKWRDSGEKIAIPVAGT